MPTHIGLKSNESGRSAFVRAMHNARRRRLCETQWTAGLSVAVALVHLCSLPIGSQSSHTMRTQTTSIDDRRDPSCCCCQIIGYDTAPCRLCPQALLSTPTIRTYRAPYHGGGGGRRGQPGTTTTTSASAAAAALDRRTRCGRRGGNPCAPSVLPGLCARTSRPRPRAKTVAGSSSCSNAGADRHS